MDRANVYGDAVAEGQRASALYLPEVYGTYVSSPHVTEEQVGDSLDVRVDLTPETWAPSSTKGIIGKGYGTAVGYYSWGLLLNVNNNLYFKVSNNAAAILFTVTNTLSGRGRIRCHFIRDGVAGTWVINAYVSDDFSEPIETTDKWVLRKTVGSTSSGPIIDTAYPILVGTDRTGADGSKGLYHAAAIIIDGSIVASWDGRIPATRQRDPQGNIWTVSGTANGWVIS